MFDWPSSAPHYKWPQRLLSRQRAVHRFLLSLTFNAAHLAGRMSRFLRIGGRAILVIRTDGIGGAVLFEPAIRSLSAAFPDSQVHLWAPAATCELLSRHPAIWHSWPIPRGSEQGNLLYFSSFFWRTVMGWRLARHQFDVAIYAVQSPEPLGNWVLCSARAKEKWYLPGDTANQFDWQRQQTAAVATRLLTVPAGDHHELTRNEYLSSQLGGWVDGGTSTGPVLDMGHAARWTAQTIAERWRLVAAGDQAHRFVGIMAGSAMAANQYPIASWERIIRSLWQASRTVCVLFGGLADAPRVDQIARRIGDIPHFRLSRRVNLRTTASLIREMDGFITLDTGLAHLAVAQDVPTVILAHGGYPGRFFPWPTKTRSITLTHPVPCQGCLCRCVQNEAICVTRIDPEEVVAAYMALVQPPNRAAA